MPLRLDPTSLVEVRWPSGHVDRVTDVPADRYVTLTEGEGLEPGPGAEARKE